MRPHNYNTPLRGFLAGIVATAIFTSAACVSAPQPSPFQQELQTQLDAFLQENEGVPGIAFAVIGPDDTASFAAAGTADPTGRAMTVSTPVRIASNTKTYTAAAILRLWEMGRINLDAPIAELIDPQFEALLREDGYNVQAITVRHLLMHVSGMPDHADDQYIEIIFSDPHHEWTREEQVALLTKNHDPLGGPEEVYQYSDTGYVLLGHIIEKITGQSLAASVRNLLSLDRLGLRATWWERVETAPSWAVEPATQFFGGQNTKDFNPSIDLYGGGGIVASVDDLAQFWTALMRGDVFEEKETLELMLSAPGHPFPDRYRMGVFPRKLGETEIFFHSGAWGTIAAYVPELDVAIAGVVTEQAGFGPLTVLAIGVIGSLVENTEQSPEQSTE